MFQTQKPFLFIIFKFCFLFTSLFIAQLSLANDKQGTRSIYEFLGVPSNASQEKINKAIEEFSKQSYYEILGLPKTANKEDITKAYRSLARRVHPDTKETETEKQIAGRLLKIINNAHEIIQNPELRAKYDKKLNNASSELEQGVFKSRQFKDIFTQSQDLEEQKELTPRERELVNLFHQFSFFREDINSFLANQDRYNELYSKKESGERLTNAEQRELIEFNNKDQIDIKNFEKILSKMGLPKQNLPPVLLRVYLNSLKQEWYLQKNYTEVQLKLTGGQISPRQEIGSNRLLNEHEIVKVSEIIKQNFDSMNYEGLRQQSNPISKTFWKSFPAQFVLFTAAIGSSVYLKYLYQNNIDGFEKNPDEFLQTMEQNLTPFAFMSFLVFVGVANQVSYRMYGLGRAMDGKSFLGQTLTGKSARSLAPAFGLGIGFFVSGLFTDLWHDSNFNSCVADGFKSDKQESQSATTDYESACDKFYNTWKAEEKWKTYSVDIVALIGSSVISHKLVNLLTTKLVHQTVIGTQITSTIVRRVGTKLLGYVGFFIQLLAFMEVHKGLELWAGQPLKQQIKVGGMRSSLDSVLNRIKQLGQIPVEYWKNKTLSKENSDQTINLGGIYSGDQNLYSTQLGKTQEGISRLIYQQLKDSIKETGNRFKVYAQDEYATSFYYWSLKLNEKLANYEVSQVILQNISELSKEEVTNNEDLQYQKLYKSSQWIVDNFEQVMGRKFNSELIKNPIKYLSSNKDEIFSSDPAYFIPNLMAEHEYELALYETGRDLAYSMNVRNVSRTNMQTNLALGLLTEGLKIEDKELSKKALAAGIYLLQKISDSFGGNLKSISDRANSFEVYKKGESLFKNRYVQNKEPTKDLMSKSLLDLLKDNNNGKPYFVMKDLMCASISSKLPVAKQDVFITPRIIENKGIEIYNFNKEKFDTLEEACKDIAISKSPEESIHKLLFNTPAKYNSKNYETLYLVIEEIIGSADKAFLRTYYKEQSEEQLKLIREELQEDLNLLVNNYYVNMLNRESQLPGLKIENESTEVEKVTYYKEHLSSYYTKENLYFNWCALGHDLTFKYFLNDCMTKTYKGLESTVFEMNYWLSVLSDLRVNEFEIKSKSCQTDNEQDFCANIKEETQALRQHCSGKEPVDCYKQYLEDKKAYFVSTLQTHHDSFISNSDLAVQFDRELMLEEIAGDFHANSYIISALTSGAETQELKAASDFDKLIHSVLAQIASSLNSFSSRVHILNIKSDFDKRTD